MGGGGSNITRPWKHSQGSRLQTALATTPVGVGLLWLLTAICYQGQLGNGFCLDDTAMLFDNRFVVAGAWGDIWTSSYWHGVTGERGGLYRPILLTLAAAGRRLFGQQAVYYHLGGILLQGLAATSVMFASRGTVAGPRTAWFAGALFAVCPAASEVVCSVVGTADQLALILGLTGAVLLLRATTTVAMLPAAALLMIAALCKESAAIFAFGAFGVLGVRQRTKAAVVAAMTLVVPIALRVAVTGRLGAGATGFLDNPLAYADAVDRCINAPALGLRYLLLAVFPWPLSADYSYDAIPLLTVADAVIWVPAGLLCLSMLWCLRRVCNHWLLWVLLTVAMLGLATHVVMPLGTIYAERLAYPVLAAAAVGAAALLHSLRRHGHTAGVVIAVGLLLIMSQLTGQRVADWHDDGTLFASAVRVQGNSARAHYGLGLWHQQQDRPQDAVASYDAALRIHRRYADALYNRGAALLRLGRQAQALASFEDAVAARPAYVQALFAVAALRETLGVGGALEAYQAVLRHSPDHAEARLGVARCLQASGSQ